MEAVCSSETSGVLLIGLRPTLAVRHDPLGVETYNLRNHGLTKSRAIGLRTSLEAMANSETDSIEIYMQTFHYTNGTPPSFLTATECLNQYVVISIKSLRKHNVRSGR
jgi:hypothetical protein